MPSELRESGKEKTVRTAGGDCLNLCRETLMDFQSITLTTHTQQPTQPLVVFGVTQTYIYFLFFIKESPVWNSSVTPVPCSYISLS